MSVASHAVKRLRELYRAVLGRVLTHNANQFSCPHLAQEEAGVFLPRMDSLEPRMLLSALPMTEDPPILMSPMAAVAPLAIATPTNVSATDGTLTDKVTVTWTAAATATGYEVWRNTTSSTGTNYTLRCRCR